MIRLYKGGSPTDGKADPRMKESYPWVGFAIRGSFFPGPCQRRGAPFGP